MGNRFPNRYTHWNTAVSTPIRQFDICYSLLSTGLTSSSHISNVRLDFYYIIGDYVITLSVVKYVDVTAWGVFSCWWRKHDAIQWRKHAPDDACLSASHHPFLGLSWQCICSQVNFTTTLTFSLLKHKVAEHTIYWHRAQSRLNDLSYGMKTGLIFLQFCHNSRVWQTDGQTDRILIARSRLHSIQRGKNDYHFCWWTL